MESDKDIFRQAMFEAIDEQIRDRNPPAAKQAFDRLIGEGYSKEDAMGLIARVLVVEMSRAVEGEEYNEERYVGALNTLPALPPDD